MTSQPESTENSSARQAENIKKPKTFAELMLEENANAPPLDPDFNIDAVQVTTISQRPDLRNQYLNFVRDSWLKAGLPENTLYYTLWVDGFSEVAIAALYKETVIGCLLGNYMEDKKEIGMYSYFYVNPTYRGKNIGNMISNKLLSILTTCKTVGLTTEKGHIMEPVYLKLGFQHTECDTFETRKGILNLTYLNELRAKVKPFLEEYQILQQEELTEEVTSLDARLTGTRRSQLLGALFGSKRKLLLCRATSDSRPLGYVFYVNYDKHAMFGPLLCERSLIEKVGLLLLEAAVSKLLEIKPASVPLEEFIFFADSRADAIVVRPVLDALGLMKVKDRPFYWKGPRPEWATENSPLIIFRSCTSF